MHQSKPYTLYTTLEGNVTFHTNSCGVSRLCKQKSVYAHVCIRTTEVMSVIGSNTYIWLLIRATISAEVYEPIIQKFEVPRLPHGACWLARLLKENTFFAQPLQWQTKRH